MLGAEKTRKEKMENGKAEAGSSLSPWASQATVSAEKDEVFEKDLVHEVGDEEEDDGDVSYVPGPLIPLKEQLEKDKEDESLRRWKEKLLGCVEDNLNDKMEPEVNFQSIGIYSDNFLVMTTPLPLKDSGSRILFALKEGSVYRLNLKFTVKHNIVSGLRYTNTVWKSGLKVDQSFGMLGTFAPQRYPYMHILEEETTPSGPLARGIYSAKLKFEDDDKRCHVELDYCFEIKKR